MSALAEKYGITVGGIRGILRRRGVQARRPGGKALEFTREQVGALVYAYQSGLSQEQVAAKFRIGQVTVGRILRSEGVEMRRVIGCGSENGNWKRGRTKVQGYTLVYLDPGDPLAIMRNRMGYVGEHRLVMARHLGRPLLRTETVHHKDGDRSNNDITNLQLRQGQHGNGAAWVCLDCGSHNVAVTVLV